MADWLTFDFGEKMMRFLKWFAGATGLAVLVVGFIFGYYLYSFSQFGSIPSGGLLSPDQAAYDINFYDISLEVSSADKRISGSVTIYATVLSEELAFVELDLVEGLIVSQISFGEDDSLSFIHKKRKLIVYLERPLGTGEKIVLQVDYAGRPLEARNPPWMGGFNWSKDSQGNDWIGLSCQGEGAKVWFPCKDHPSDEPDSAAINITVPEAYVVAANGLLRGTSVPRNGFKTYHWFTGYPINNYDINFGIAKYVEVETTYTGLDGRELPVIFYVLPEAAPGGEKLLGMAVDMLETYRIYFGEYPFMDEKFGLLHTDYLGMEHQTINAYGNKYRFDSVAGTEYDWLMMHEMGHEWWGNKVTVSDWSHYWIQEGICTYGEALYMREKGGEDAYHAFMQRKGKQISNRHPVSPPLNATTTEAYSSDAYTKGAYFMHSLRYVVGDSIFFPALYHFATDSAYTYKQLVTTDDWLQLLNKRSGMDLSDFFYFYLKTTKVLEVDVTDAGEGAYELRVANIDFALPVELVLDGVSKRGMLGPEAVLVRSSARPQIDPRQWYLREVNYR